MLQFKAYVQNETRVIGEYWNCGLRNSWKIQPAEGHGVELRVGEEYGSFNVCRRELQSKIRFFQYSTDDSIQNHYIQHQSIIHTQSNKLILVNFSEIKLSLSFQHSPQPVILRGADGKVAESILQQTTLPVDPHGGEAAM